MVLTYESSLEGFFFFFRRQITLVLIFEKMCKLLRLSARSHSRDFFTLSCTPFHMLIPTISSASIRRPVQGSGRLLSGAEPISRQHQRPCLSSRSGKPAPPTPRLPAPLPCFSRGLHAAPLFLINVSTACQRRCYHLLEFSMLLLTPRE